MTANRDTSDRNLCPRSNTFLNSGLPSAAHFSALWYCVLNGVIHEVALSLCMALATTERTDLGELSLIQSCAALKRMSGLSGENSWLLVADLSL